jgi:hypothetical protein
MPNPLNVNIPNMLKQNTKLKSKNQNLEKNDVTLSRNTLHKITLLVLLKIKILLLNSKSKKENY